MQPSKKSSFDTPIPQNGAASTRIIFLGRLTLDLLWFTGSRCGRLRSQRARTQTSGLCVVQGWGQDHQGVGCCLQRWCTLAAVMKRPPRSLCPVGVCAGLLEGKSSCSSMAMAQALDLVPWPPDASPVYAAPAVLIPLEPKKSLLAGVKEQLYHPCLPTLRRMDMDTVVNRLTDQHCRTSTTCSKGIWDRPASLQGMAELVRRSLAGRSRAGKLAPLPPSTSPEEWPSYTRAMQDWSRFVSAAGEMPLLNLQGKVLGFSCYAVRYLKPDVTQTWRVNIFKGQRAPLPGESNLIAIKALSQSGLGELWKKEFWGFNPTMGSSTP
uniref:Sperm microtubule inner protein 8 n=1 Tax=Pseudonaja textilis TaxID=8673 RepID=A0A670YDI3_PSETE